MRTAAICRISRTAASIRTATSTITARTSRSCCPTAARAAAASPTRAAPARRAAAGAARARRAARRTPLGADRAVAVRAARARRRAAVRRTDRPERLLEPAVRPAPAGAHRAAARRAATRAATRRPAARRRAAAAGASCRRAARPRRRPAWSRSRRSRCSAAVVARTDPVMVGRGCTARVEAGGGAPARRGLAFVALVAAGWLAPSPAWAQFYLDSPTNWVAQQIDGTPQKEPPCGNEGMATPTGVVTAFASNADGTVSVAITLHETVFHPGHYRVALAPDQDSLPPDPDVTPSAMDACATAAVQASPTLPVVADNLLVHSTPFTGPQTFTVTVPAAVRCDPVCTLQVVEFMSSRPAPCFYHHCAEVSFEPPDAAGAPGPVDSGGAAEGGADAAPAETASTGGGRSSGSCGVAGDPRAPAGAAAGALLALAAAARRRRRR